MQIGRSGDDETANANRRKKAGLPDNNESGKFIINNWFRLVVIGFMVIFAYQLNGIKNKRAYTSYVTIDGFDSSAMNDLRDIRRGK